VQEAVGVIASVLVNHPDAAITVLFAPPACYLEAAKEAAETHADARLSVMGQDVHCAREGPYTGSISAPMMAEVGAQWALIGHSETRAQQQLSEEDVLVRAQSAWDAGLRTAMCFGEDASTMASDERNKTLQHSAKALASRARTAELSLSEHCLCYEPVWAIGAGRTPKPDEIADAHAALRRGVREGGFDADRVSVIYGGSVSADNARILLEVEGVDGLLVGSASLRAESFTTILNTACIYAARENATIASV
jgi:triosephosphate isomerase